MTKKELEKLLKYHDDLYYNKDNPELTDEEYDALKNIYVEKYGEYNYVPGKAMFKKFKHVTPIRSLDKVNIVNEEEVMNHIKRLWPIVIQPKMDGLTLVYYSNTHTYTTRGNGLEGENITDKIGSVLGIGDADGITRPIRAEIVMTHEEFERINKERIEKGLKPFTSIRNAAAGMLRRESVDSIEGLVSYAYNIIRPGIEDNNMIEQMQTLEEHGWNTVFTAVPETPEEALDFILNFDRTTLNYDIDGLVIKHNGNKVFGETEHHPNNAIAIKFKSQGEWTTIKEIVNQVGRTGKIVPVAKVNPINVMGATINSCTLHNYGQVEILDLNSYNNETLVKVVRSNDVIPAIIGVKHNDKERDLHIEAPKFCPACGGEVEMINVQLYCMNPNCSAKKLNRLIHFASRDAFNIEGLSEATAEKLINLYTKILKQTLAQMMNAEEVGEVVDYEGIEKEMEVMHPSFVFNLSKKNIEEMDKFAEISSSKLYNQIQNAKNIKLDKFIYGCGIPLIGVKTARDIANYYCSWDNGVKGYLNMAEDRFNDFKGLSSIKGIGKETIDSFIKYWNSNVVPYGNVEGLNIEDVEVIKAAENQLTFAITGSFSMPRKNIQDLIKSKGHKVSSSVSKKTDYLLASPGEESTSKYKSAIKNNVTIINSLEELNEILK